MQANAAYDALKNPLQRARHLLSLHSIRVGGEQDSVKPSHELLMEIMTLREALEDANSILLIESLKTANAHSILMLTRDIAQSFKTEAYNSAAQLTLKLGYLVKMEEEIRLRAKALL